MPKLKSTAFQEMDENMTVTKEHPGQGVAVLGTENDVPALGFALDGQTLYEFTILQSKPDQEIEGKPVNVFICKNNAEGDDYVYSILEMVDPENKENPQSYLITAIHPETQQLMLVQCAANCERVQ